MFFGHITRKKSSFGPHDWLFPSYLLGRAMLSAFLLNEKIGGELLIFHQMDHCKIFDIFCESLDSIRETWRSFYTKYLPIFQWCSDFF